MATTENDTKWRVQLAENEVKMHQFDVSALLSDDNDMYRDPIFTPIFGKKLDYGHLFAYLFRRFGYPNRGWDDYKDHSCYMLTTPREDVMVSVRPYVGSNTDLHFSIVASAEAMQGYGELYRRKDRPKTWQELDEPFRSMCEAADMAGRDLLTPVYVRDCAINAAGYLTDDESAMFESSADFAISTGYPSGYLGNINPELMSKIHKTVHRLGNGDIAAGMKAILKLAGEPLEMDADE